MHRHSVQQLLIRAHLCIGILAFWAFPSLAGQLSDDRAASRTAALVATDNIDEQLDRGQAVVGAAIGGRRPPTPAASAPNFPGLLDQIATGLTLPRLPPESSIEGSTLPGDPDQARQIVAVLIANLVRRFDLTVAYAGEPPFATSLLTKLSSNNKKVDELVDNYAKAGNHLAEEYASALGYDVNDIRSKYQPQLIRFLQLAQNHGLASRSADDTLRAKSRPLLALARKFVQEENVLLGADKAFFDQLASRLAEQARALRAEGDEIAEAIAQNRNEIDALLTKERVLADSAKEAAERARATGREDDRDAAKAAEKELRGFRSGMKAALEEFEAQKRALTERDNRNKVGLDQLRKDAASALAPYQTYERRQISHASDEETLKTISF